MTRQGFAHDEAPQAPTGKPPGESLPSYTGVIIVHGIGNEKRNETLQQALNALTYWFSSVAGLTTRPAGAGRIWLSTRLTDADDPDKPASCATMELVAPAGDGEADDTLRLEWREVWWAQAFGLPSAKSALSWAWSQWAEEGFRILLPVRKLVTVLTPWRERELATGTSSRTEPSQTALGAPASSSPGSSSDGQGRRVWRRRVLAVYDFVQDVWKFAQWLLITPLLFGVLLLVGAVQSLAPLPGIEAILGGLSRILDFILLHWIASTQVYLLDYTRSASIRQAFDRELQYLLEDPHCQQIVVIAYSMGTAVAYEGLTTLLAPPEAPTTPEALRDRPIPKAISFVCMAQSLRRMWYLTRTDPHRLRGVLPRAVRWVHFWARYDLVAPGILEPSALPSVHDWTDPYEQAPDSAIRDSLREVENSIVVNTDALLRDHTSYWDNLEQVVGPIARELVTGHPALERLVDTHLATPDDVQDRRWRVAWRASLALAGGAIAGIATLLFTRAYRLGPATRQALADLFALGLQLPLFLGVLWRLAAELLAGLGARIQGLGLHLLGPAGLETLTGLAAQGIDWVIVLAAATVVGTIGFQVASGIFALPSPFVFREPGDRPSRAAPNLPQAQTAKRVRAR